jgi:hypothetical protein
MPATLRLVTGQFADGMSVFAKPLSLGARAVGWLESDIEWIANSLSAPIPRNLKHLRLSRPVQMHAM